MIRNLLDPDMQAALAAINKAVAKEQYNWLERLHTENPDEYFKQKDELIKSSRFYEAPKSEALELDTDWD